MAKLDGKVAVVTGAASGMGKAIAALYAKEGAKVVASDLNLEGVQQTVAEIEAAGGKALAVQANVASEEDVQHLIDTAVKEYGTLDILVNNAGIMDNMVPAGDLTDALWEKVFAVNTTGPMRTIRKSLPIFIEKGNGVIVNVASVGGLNGSRAGAAYTASKHAVIGLTKNVGFQYVLKGIRCNAIAPGGVETNIGTTMSEPNAFGLERAMSGSAINPRSGKPEEIATIALFLASDDASFVNGAVITADAGWTAY
ncbi:MULTISPECIES: SDR family oxidoreductase [Heyndrickxia]|jgi:NAD(P)-dependent dehydrogenase (short-subunit alcohol dehydrogenase family)|uniref:Short-chain dehydrogenase/reductase SDR n=3 Tax=Heyndrickxia TaxID=2837504 RepID=G2TMN6_HEYCO|nr:SDR family oxidoreductase [Heyndrickxia coagulans]AEO99527.1 short-chain dehydrogenase/reductase SDR [Heyndrickxia coagulans 36D1]AWP36480.1 NAD(P)-dependent oxidoreductase [Heyndrickxia coagulans]KWZ77644.1 putative glucose 1-dehydrogenase [Heyndrickxia coagulans]QDI61986.1 SDR family oxidoreductase [Heyndrickxia coagulans]UXC23429.1 SDR family oxidoreductase [Heyndrickxia coagulans]